MSCKTEGFVFIGHNDKQDFESNVLSKIFNVLTTEPALQPGTIGRLPINAVQHDEARLYIREGGFLRKGRNTFFDVRVTNANAKSQNKIMLKIYS